jgi:PAS domain S-box-containing protein
MPIPQPELRLEASPEALEQVLRGLSSEAPSEPGAALRAIVWTGAAALRVERASLWLLDEEGEGLACRERYPLEACGGSRADAPVCARLARLGELRLDDAPDPLDGSTPPPGAAIEAAVWRGGETVGMLRLERPGGSWTWVERFFIDALASHLSRELERARVLEAEASNLELARDVDQHHAREERFRRMIENSSDLVQLLDPRGRVIYTGPSIERLLGYSPEEVQGTDPLTILHPGDVERIAAELEELLLHPGEVRKSEYRVLHRNGEWRRFEAMGRTFAPDSPEQGFVINARDVTERRQVEEALQEREEYFRKLIENTSDIITILEPDGTIRYQSPAVERLLGYRSGELDGRNAFELIHEEDHAPTLREFAELVAHPGTTRSVTYRFRHAEGGWCVLESTGRTISPTGPQEGVVINSRDVTERIEAQEALRFQTALLETQNDAAIDGILVAREGQVLSMNTRYAELFRVPEELRPLERCGEMLRWCVSQTADPQEYLARIERLRNDPEAVRRDEVLLADGRVFDRYSAPLKSSDGVSYGRIWILRDITERKQTEEALRQAKDDAERANRAKSEFLSRMSHELRTPMNSILGFAQLLNRVELPGQQGKSVQHILKAGRHLLHLINEVLEIARIEAGRQNFSLEPVRISSVTREAVSLVRPLAAQWCVDVQEASDSRDAFVMADRQRLVQVMLNLLSNAIKYNRPGGRVRIGWGSAGEGRWTVRVEDTGRGIPEEHRDQLFTPFARLGAEQTDVEGTGLGLALSQRLCEAMGGTLALEQSGPEGSQFQIDLALASEPGPAPEQAPESSLAAEAEHRPATLLYIEDNLANLSLVETILLSRPRWRTLPALQGQLGLELARQHVPDLILLDLHLPDIPGEEVLRRLRSDPRTAHIPVVVVSADATQGSLDRLRGAGADAYLTKPLDIDEFLNTIDGFLGDAGR